MRLYAYYGMVLDRCISSCSPNAAALARKRGLSNSQVVLAVDPAVIAFSTEALTETRLLSIRLTTQSLFKRYVLGSSCQE